MQDHDDEYAATKFNLSDLFIASIVIAVLLAIAIVLLEDLRGPSKRPLCMNRIKRLVLANQNYCSSRLRFPAAMGEFRSHGDHIGVERLSGFVALLPELEYQQLYDTAFSESDFNGQSYPAMPAPWAKGYPVWATEVDAFRCPEAPDANSNLGQTNYAFCIGDVGRSIHNPEIVRGAFACGKNTNPRDFVDGTSNTLFIAEIGTSQKRLINSNFAVSYPNILDNPSLADGLRGGFGNRYFAKTVNIHVRGRGASWADGAAGNGLVNTILAPNRPSVAVKNQLAVDGIYSAGSFHQDGCIVAFADGSCRYIADGIDAGDPTTSVPNFSDSNRNMPSPYGLWGALGTANGREALDFDF